MEEQAAQLELEGRTRAELEDMLLRIEKHFRAEQAARRRAEEQAAAAEEELRREKAARDRMVGGGEGANSDPQDVRAIREQLLRERAALEDARSRAEAELSAARAEARRFAEALALAEESVRQAEAVERLKMEAEHNAKIQRLAAELSRLREELDLRTQAMASEMGRWKMQADAASSAVAEAKEELLKRKKELDNTKEKMDHLVEKLYIGACGREGSRGGGCCDDGGDIVNTPATGGIRGCLLTHQESGGIQRCVSIGISRPRASLRFASCPAGREKGIELRGAIDFHLEKSKALREQDQQARQARRG